MDHHNNITLNMLLCARCIGAFFCSVAAVAGVRVSSLWSPSQTNLSADVTLAMTNGWERLHSRRLADGIIKNLVIKGLFIHLHESLATSGGGLSFSLPVLLPPLRIRQTIPGASARSDAASAFVG